MIDLAAGLQMANGESSDGLSTLVAAATALLATLVGGYAGFILRRWRQAEEEVRERLADASMLDESFRSGSLDLSRDPPSDPESERSSAKDQLLEASPEERQFQLLRQYHNQGLSQSRVSFWFSLIFAAVGFLVIITAFLSAERGEAINQQGRAFLTLLAGTIMESVASLFFVQSNHARRLMVDFFDRLRTDRKLLESLKLVTSVPDEKLRSNLQVMLALSLAEAKTSPAVLSAVYDREMGAEEVGGT